MLTVRLETVTPLFLAGAEPRGVPELRAASIRGALRFWFRALLGGVIGDTNLNALRKAESDVFGSTNSASPVVIRVQHDRLSLKPFSRITDWDETTGSYRKPGIAYLFFAARGIRNEPERNAIDAGSSFELVLSKRAGIGASGDQALQQAYAALWLLTHFGGLGARSRRGAGNLQVTQVSGKIPNSALPPLQVQADTPERLQAELQDGLERLKEMLEQEMLEVDYVNPSTFNVLHPKACKIWIVNKTFSSWDKALDAIGQQMQTFRNRRPPDYQNVKDAIQGKPLAEPVMRAAFGLPIVFYYRSLGGKKGTLEGECHSRRASPLIIRVVQLANNKFTLLLIFFRAQLLAPNEQLRLKRQESPVLVFPPDFSLIEDFVGEVDNQIAPLLEVAAW